MDAYMDAYIHVYMHTNMHAWMHKKHNIHACAVCIKNILTCMYTSISTVTLSPFITKAPLVPWLSSQAAGLKSGGRRKGGTPFSFPPRFSAHDVQPMMFSQ